ncbi:SDR family oxidoreductase [Paraburkholderia nodosa]|uniref:SDR family oxidoreductase n=1 Tax=Paraburkholderia nodosa TaxID=392320 RepID=UPI0004B502CA|nr:SDR family oxidoreductase [Paraburkholderia nodosa]
MNIKGCTALVTGANRGLGKAIVEQLAQGGAARVYAGMRNPTAVAHAAISPVRLDVTDTDSVARAVEKCSDVDLVINNAGILLATPMLAHDSEEALRRELEVNTFGPLRVVRAFAPILARNGGGAIINMLSVVSWYVYPFNATYCASKFAALAMTDAMRIELKAQGTHVMGVYAGFIDTDMAVHFTGEKTSPIQVAERMLAGLEAGQEHVLADTAAEELGRAVRFEPKRLAAWAQSLWDDGRRS